MADALEPFKIGDTVVYFDGSYWRFDSKNIKFSGYYARHNLTHLPHAEALSDKSKLLEFLGDRQYWLDRELPDRE